MEAATTTIAHARISPPMPQHMHALETANRVRLARAELKRRVRAGRLDIAEVVRECPWEAETMRIGELLGAQRRWGRIRVRKFLSLLRLGENRQLKQLTLRQRSLLAAELDAKHSLSH